MPYQKEYEKFVSVIKDNERVQNEFFEIKKRILRKHTLEELVLSILDELKSRFSLMHVGISLIKEELDMDECKLEKFCQDNSGSVDLVSDPKLIRFLIKNSKPRLQNRDIDMWSSFFSPKVIETARSVAVLPLCVDEKVVGTINLADNSRERYNPNRATSFLENLAVIVSICLTNVITHEQLRKIAITDPLTGLSNRRHIYTVLDRAFKNYRRYGDHFSLIYVDLDDFKGINDRFGHDVGDAYLKHGANILLSECRESDCVSRFGGDEFVIALCRSSLNDAVITKSRIEEKLSANPLVQNNRKLSVKASFGIASTDEGNKIESVDDLLKNADSTMYKAKRCKTKGTDHLSIAV